MVEFVVGETYKLMTLEEVILKYKRNRVLRVDHNTINLDGVRYENHIFGKEYKAMELTNWEGMNGFYADQWHMYGHIIDDEEIW